jgi:hypothetical protein
MQEPCGLSLRRRRTVMRCNTLCHRGPRAKEALTGIKALLSGPVQALSRAQPHTSSRMGRVQGTQARRNERAAFPLVRGLWWACQDLNLGPHPYQQSRAHRCATRRFPRWLPTVGGEVMRCKPASFRADRQARAFDGRGRVRHSSRIVQRSAEALACHLPGRPSRGRAGCRQASRAVPEDGQGRRVCGPADGPCEGLKDRSEERGRRAATRATRQRRWCPVDPGEGLHPARCRARCRAEALKRMLW